MKSEPPTPTRAPDNQFRNMNHINQILLEMALYQMFGVGVGGSYSIGETRAARTSIIVTHFMVNIWNGLECKRCISCVHPIPITRFRSFRTQPLESLSAAIKLPIKIQTVRTQSLEQILRGKIL